MERTAEGGAHRRGAVEDSDQAVAEGQKGRALKGQARAQGSPLDLEGRRSRPGECRNHHLCTRVPGHA
ncbi:hypothetical protein IBTHAUMO2_330012 [Nitrosopumilaceae archaeon]|nr:hypothetical protein IBTHAUMO2_330012 [Nitrosopumilaceae archaeon]